MSDKTKKRKPKIVYIAGVGHSGSTLLDLILSTSPDAFSVGEVKKLKRFVRKEGLEKFPEKKFLDDQGYELIESPFWAPIAKNLNEYLIEKGKKKSNFFNYLKICFTGQIKKMPQRYDDEKLLSAIHQQAKEIEEKEINYIIDSSKNIDRLVSLQQSNDFEVFVIYLVRDLRGYVYSRWKSGKKIFSPIFHWLFFNFLTYRYIIKNISEEKLIIVQFDFFIEQPEKFFKLFNEKINLRIDSDRYIEDIRGQVSYRFAGNKMRKSDFEGVKKDQPWKDNMLNLVKLTLAPLNWLFKFKD